MYPNSHRPTRRHSRGLIVVGTSVVMAVGLAGAGVVTGFGPISEASAAVRSGRGHTHHMPSGWHSSRNPRPPAPTASATPVPGSPTAASPTKSVSQPSADGTAGTVQTEVVSLVNAERAKAGCSALTANSALATAAQGHSADMANRNYFSHDTLGGGSFADRITAAGYQWSGAAENIASGQRTAADVMQSWMNSSGHRANILNCGYRDIGVGLAANATGTLYWTQDFASPR